MSSPSNKNVENPLDRGQIGDAEPNVAASQSEQTSMAGSAHTYKVKHHVYLITRHACETQGL